MDYSIERIHDQQLIDVVIELNNARMLDIFSNSFDLPHLSEHIRAQRRRPFDVEVSFDNLSVVVEKKVDSNEGHDDEDEKIPWQTLRIVEKTRELD